MSDRLHEIMGEIGVLHKELLESGKIDDANEVFDAIEDKESDLKDHYLNLLLQFYFQKNDLTNLKELLLVGAKFDMRFSDIKDAFVCINSNKENVIEFMEDNVVFTKDKVLVEPLLGIYEYYTNNKELQVCLEQAIELIRRNRYVCAFCYNNPKYPFSEFFINEDLLESIKRDLPYLIA